MANWIRVAAVHELADGDVREVVAGERVIALFRVAGRFFALDGLCPHQGGPLGRGRLVGSVVACPWHGWRFDVATGQHQANDGLRHPCLAVKVEEDDVLVDVSA